MFKTTQLKNGDHTDFYAYLLVSKSWKSPKEIEIFGPHIWNCFRQY